jgi:transcriptional regulator with XRE-family HTH domain
MGFRENLKEELSFAGIFVKELATKTGLNKRTIDKHLRTNGSIPSAEAAVRIAQALGVTVEYLVAGQDFQPLSSTHLRPPVRHLVKLAETLDDEHCEVVVGLAEALKKLQERRQA